MHRHRGWRRAAYSAVGVVLLLSACTGDDDNANPVGSQTPSTVTSSTETPSTEASAPLPPSSFEELEAIFAPRYEALGLTLTRASMVELDGGPHLQLYVEPPGAFTTDQYVDNIVPTTAAVVPFIFEQYEDLASFDICQEPPPGVDDSVAPEQVTVVALTRAQAEGLDWPAPELAELMAAVEGAAFGEVRGNDEVEASTTFQEAAAAG